MVALWESLGTMEKVFWTISILASFLFILQLGASLLGLDSDHNPDVSAPGDTPGFHIFTPQNFAAFFALFGWTGLACINGGMGTGAVLALATVGGIVAMILVAGLIYLMSKLGEDSTFDMKSVVGAHAKVYIPIPASRNGSGKVTVTRGSLHELDAVTDGEKLATGLAVKITAVIDDSTLLVERV